MTDRKNPVTPVAAPRGAVATAATTHAALLDSAAVGDDPRLARLLSLYAPAYQLAARTLGAARDAEDVVQQAYVKALGHLPAELPDSEVQPWFFRVVVNAARDQLRSDRRRQVREAATGQLDSQTNGVLPEGVTQETLADLQACLLNLDERYRLPLVLCYEQGLTQNAAAQVLDMPARTVSKYLEDGLEQLRKKMAERGHTTAPALLIAMLPFGAAQVPIDLERIAREVLRRQPHSPVPDPAPAISGDERANAKPEMHIVWKILINILAGIAILVVSVGILLMFWLFRGDSHAGPSSTLTTPPNSDPVIKAPPVQTP